MSKPTYEELEQERDELAAQVEWYKTDAAYNRKEKDKARSQRDKVTTQLKELQARIKYLENNQIPENHPVLHEDQYYGLVARVQRLRKMLDSAIRGEEIIVGHSVVIAIDCETADEINEVLDETPTDALAALKAKWRGVVIRDAITRCNYCGTDGEEWASELAQIEIAQEQQYE